MDFKKVKNEKGITLIALAVTIVVLLILAGVTISSVFSENGIIKKAQQAQETINKAQENDINAIEKLTSEMEKYTNSNDTVGVDLSEYATLDFQAYVGRRAKQKCDYMQIFIEISDADNSEDKITYAIGTDWQENIVKENDKNNQLFLKGNSSLDLLNVVENDKEHTEYTNEDNEFEHHMSYVLVSGFTDVKVSDLYVKKGKIYNIKIGTKVSHYVNHEVTTDILYFYDKNTEIVEDNLSVEVSKKEIDSKLYVMYDVSSDGYVTPDDAEQLKIVRAYNDNINKRYVEKGDSTEIIIILVDENGNFINEEAKKYVGFDYDRNGCIDADDERYINNMYRDFGAT